MSTQPKALQLADALEWPGHLQPGVHKAAAAELRRLHGENELLHKRCQQGYKVGRQSAQDDMDALLRQALDALDELMNSNSTKTAQHKYLAVTDAIRQHLEGEQ